MKRIGYLTEKIADLFNLYLAYYKARLGKQAKQKVVRYGKQLDEHLQKLRARILDGDVTVGNYHYFRIFDPKERIICAASFDERVLHHALMNVCHPYFDRSLVDDTFATRKGKGVYAAIQRAQVHARRHAFVAKLDVRKYYDSVDHAVLKAQLRRKFKDAILLRIFDSIIESYHTEPGKGLPIGNLTSQYFANMYLSVLDHFALERWGAAGLVRYMDDILLFSDDKAALKQCVHCLTQYAFSELQLTMKPPVLAKSQSGIPFLGYRVFPYQVLLAGRSKRRFRSKLMTYTDKYASGEWSEKTYADHLLPLLAFTQHAVSRDFRKSCLAAIR